MRTLLTKRLGIRYPIIQAPMANATDAKLVTVVSNLGGLGSLGAARMSPQEIRLAIREIRQKLAAPNLPFNVNLFAPRDHFKDYVHPPTVQHRVNMRQCANEMRQELGMEPIHEDDDTSVDTYLLNEPGYSFEDQLNVVLEEKVPVFSFTFGIPPLDLLKSVRQNGTLIMGTVNSLEEALLLNETGVVDFIVAQGLEAGGHRAQFTQSEMMPLFSLVQQIVRSEQIDTERVPVVASGGIHTGDAIVSMLALGASGVQVGTAFLPTHESCVSETNKQVLLSGQFAEQGTVLTKVFSGRQCRFLRNRVMRELHRHESGCYPYPLQTLVMNDLFTEAKRQQHADLVPVMCGQNFALCKNQPTSAAQVFQQLVSETESCLHRLNTI